MASQTASALAERKALSSTGYPSGRKPFETPLMTKRLDLGLSASDVCNALEIAPATFSRIERGLSMPMVSTAILLASFFESTVEELWGWVNPEYRSNRSSLMTATAPSTAAGEAAS